MDLSFKLNVKCNCMTVATQCIQQIWIYRSFMFMNVVSLLFILSRRTRECGSLSHYYFFFVRIYSFLDFPLKKYALHSWTWEHRNNATWLHRIEFIHMLSNIECEQNFILFINGSSSKCSWLFTSFWIVINETR